jgi:6-phosphogluconolactonase
VVCHHTNLLAVADYGGGSIGAWILEGDGRIGGQAAFFQNTHASKATGRQQQPHAHGVTFSPSGNRLLVPDLGADRVYVYEQYAASSGYKPNETAPWIELPPGRGPRHVAFPQWTQSEQRDLYVLNELSNTISVFKYDYDAHQKAFTFVEEVSTLPEGFEGQSTAAELIVREKTVYASNRGHDSIARFQRDPETGRLTLLDCTPCGGKGPRHLSLMPGGLWMLVANQQSNNIALFSIGGNGALTLVPDGGVDIGAPVCVVFE